MDKISKHVSYKEGVHSVTALRLGLKNDPSDVHLANMKLIAEKVFEPLRMHVGGPIKINSFYLSADQLNHNIVTGKQWILTIHLVTCLMLICISLLKKT
jgi:hypothetical protein